MSSENTIKEAARLKLRAVFYREIAKGLRACAHHEKPTARIKNAIKKANPEAAIHYEKADGFRSPQISMWGTAQGCVLSYGDKAYWLIHSRYDIERHADAAETAAEEMEAHASNLLNFDPSRLSAISAEMVALRKQAEDMTADGNGDALWEIRNQFPEIFGGRS